MSDGTLSPHEIDTKQVPFGGVNEKTRIVDAGGTGTPYFEASNDSVRLYNKDGTVDEWLLSIKSIPASSPYGTVGRVELSTKEAAWTLGQISNDGTWTYVEW